MATKPKVTQRPNQPEIPAELIAQDISAIAASMRRLSNSNLNRKAIIVLLQSQSGLPQSTIKTVLDCLESIGTAWLKNS